MHNKYASYMIALFVPVSVLSAQMVHYPAPDGIPHNDDFAVRVRASGGQWQELFTYDVLVDMHNRRHASMATFDFNGSVDVEITKRAGGVESARIRPLSCGIQPQVSGSIISFTLTKPANVSVEVNGDLFHNLHLFTNPLESSRPDPDDPNVIFISPGLHTYPGGVLEIPSGKTLYLAGGAVVNAGVRCRDAQDIRIAGRGILYQAAGGAIELTRCSNVAIEDVIVINPKHYTVCGGQSQNVSIKNLRSFSAEGWGDGIDLMSCSDFVIDGVFMRNSDDCIALYAHRWDHYGDTRNVIVKNSALWADVAHPINIGTHGNSQKPETIEDIVFENIDILNHDEPQIGYQGCMAISACDENLVRNVRFENIRVDDFERGMLLNLRVDFNKKYATAPGRGIENILFKDITYTGTHASLSLICGYNENRMIKNVTFENLTINGKKIYDAMPGKPSYFQTADIAGIFVNPHIEALTFTAR